MVHKGNKPMGDTRRTLKNHGCLVMGDETTEKIFRLPGRNLWWWNDGRQATINLPFNLSLNTSSFSCSPSPQHSTWVYYASEPVENSLYCCNDLPQQTKCPTCKPRQCPILISCACDDMGLTVWTNHTNRRFPKNHVNKQCLCWLCNDSCSCCWLRWTLIGLWLWVRVCWRWHVILRVACTLKAHYKQSWRKK